MHSMCRRILRIFMVVGLVGVVVAAVALWHRIYYVWAAYAGFEGERCGVTLLVCFGNCGWEIDPGETLRPLTIGDYLYLPEVWLRSAFPLGPPALSFFMPWWFLLLLWSLCTAVVFRLTVPRKQPSGFPVEPRAKPG